MDSWNSDANPDDLLLIFIEFSQRMDENDQLMTFNGFQVEILIMNNNVRFNSGESSFYIVEVEVEVEDDLCVSNKVPAEG